MKTKSKRIAPESVFSHVELSVTLETREELDSLYGLMNTNKGVIIKNVVADGGLNATEDGVETVKRAFYNILKQYTSKYQ